MLVELFLNTSMPQSEQIKPWLDFLSTLIWQIMIIVTLIYFRKQISELFGRVAKIKSGNTEVTFNQPQSEDSISLGGKALTELEIIDTAGFFTSEGIRRLIADSGLIQPGEEVKRVLLIFQTRRQQTWLVSTNRQLYCVLDDEDTRASRKLIQWRMSLSEAKPITARRYKPTVGLVDIGTRRNWLYSTYLYHSPDKLETEIDSMVSDVE